MARGATRPALLAVAATAVACSGSQLEGPVPTRTVALDRAFELRVGERVEVEGTGLAVTFLGVREDSRCPAGARCVWEGNAAVALELAIGRRMPQTATVHTGVEPRAVAIAGYEIRLVELEPAPTLDGPPDPGTYVVTLTASAL